MLVLLLPTSYNSHIFILINVLNTKNALFLLTCNFPFVKLQTAIHSNRHTFYKFTILINRLD